MGSHYAAFNTMRAAVFLRKKIGFLVIYGCFPVIIFDVIPYGYWFFAQMQFLGQEKKEFLAH